MNILIVYERRFRELENAVLLAIELERRGHKVDIKQFYQIGNMKNTYNSILVPHLYDTKSIPRIISRFGKPNNIINLQYEQVLSKKWEELGHHNPKGEAINAFHICWGYATKDRLVKAGVPDENVYVLGALQLDLLRSDYRKLYFKDINSYLKKYNLTSYRKINLFISSFTYADISDQRLKMNENGPKISLQDFKITHTNSRNILLEWFENILKNNENDVLIYRPHPDELELEKVKKLSDKYSNFKIIQSGPVKDWIYLADSVYSWYSTSVVEAHFLDKDYCILRPIELSAEFDSVLLKYAKNTTKEIEFENRYSSNGENNNKPLSNENIEKYYKNFSEPNFEKYSNFIEEKQYEHNKFKIPMNMWIKAYLTTYIIKNVLYVYRSKRLKNLFRRNKTFNSWFREFDNQFVYENEINEIKIKLKNVIKG